MRTPTGFNRYICTLVALDLDYIPLALSLLRGASSSDVTAMWSQIPPEPLVIFYKLHLSLSPAGETRNIHVYAGAANELRLRPSERAGEFVHGPGRDLWHNEEIGTSVECRLECLPHVIHALRKYKEASFASIYDSFFVARGTLGALLHGNHHHLKRGCVTVYARGGSVASTPSIAGMRACLRRLSSLR